MSLIIATGTNLNNKLENLHQAKALLSEKFEFIAESSIYTSAAIEYLNQPDFYNQVLEFKTPELTPPTILTIILEIEKLMGRVRVIDKGPRIIDIDIIFFGLLEISLPDLKIPHPAWSQRSFVVKPLQQLPFYQTLKKHFIIPTEFNNIATPI